MNHSKVPTFISAFVLLLAFFVIPAFLTDYGTFLSYSFEPGTELPQLSNYMFGLAQSSWTIPTFAAIGLANTVLILFLFSDKCRSQYLSFPLTGGWILILLYTLGCAVGYSSPFMSGVIPI